MRTDPATHSYFVVGSDCVTGKRQYATKEVAGKDAGRPRSAGGAMRPYRCPLCDCWHLGNRRSTNTKSRRR